MTEYLKKFVQHMLELGPGAIELFPELSKELNRFDPRDFEPLVQCELVLARATTPRRFTTDWSEPCAYLQRVLTVLNGYRGERLRDATRSFAYLADQDLKSIVERDYGELRLRVFPSGAWKSTVILAGSVLEALLHDVLANPVRVLRANASAKVPKRGSVSLDILTSADDWKLIHLIDVAVDIGILSKDRAKSIDQVLRDYRNFVHPKKEIRAAHDCAEAEAMMSVGALEGVCNHFEKTL